MLDRPSTPSSSELPTAPLAAGRRCPVCMHKQVWANGRGQRLQQLPTEDNDSITWRRAAAAETLLRPPAPPPRADKESGREEGAEIKQGTGQGQGGRTGPPDSCKPLGWGK